MTTRAAGLRLRVGPGLPALESTRQAVLDHLAPFAPGDGAVYAVELVLEEVLTNEFKYAFDDGTAPEVQVELGVEGSDIVLAFEDAGRPFDPLQATAPRRPASIAEAPVGGLGLVLVKRFAKSLAYQRLAGRNRLRIAIEGGWPALRRGSPGP